MKSPDTPPALRALALVVVAGLAGTALFVGVLQPAWQWATYEPQTATIMGCVSQHFRAGTRYTPVARTPDGRLVAGTIFASQADCDARIGQSVVVLLHPSSKSEGRIFTFDQFWLLPTVVLAACTLSLGLALWVRHWRARRVL